MSQEFTVVVPTIRQGLPGFKETIADIEASFTRPTEFHVLDGRGGKVAALNRAFDQVLLLTETPVYVTLDDDFVPPTGWQDKVALALEEFSHVGVVCPWPGNEQVWIDYVGVSVEIEGWPSLSSPSPLASHPGLSAGLPTRDRDRDRQDARVPAQVRHL